MFAEWERFLTAQLYGHEARHRDHGVSAANAVHRALSALTPEATCPAMGAKARNEARKHIDHHHRLDREYDERTRWGRTEGAILR